MVTFFAATILIIVALISTVLLGAFLRVYLKVLGGGPSLAAEAYERGDRLGVWYDPSKRQPTQHPSFETRAGMSVRVSREYGRHVVEERAPTHEL